MSALTETQMARDTVDRLHSIGLPESWKVKVDSRIAAAVLDRTNTHQLPLYSDLDAESSSALSRQMARVDLIVLDTEARSVEMLVEFELDTNPKNLIGNALWPMFCSNYRDRSDMQSYQLNPQRTDVYVLACLKRQRNTTPRDSAAVIKGRSLKEGIESLAKDLSTHNNDRKVRSIHVFAHDNWEYMLREFELTVSTRLERDMLSQQH